MADQTQGSGAPDASQGGGAAAGVTEEKVAEIVNRAISARNKLFEAQIGKQLDTALKSVQESVKGLSDTLAAGGEKKDKKSKDGGGDDENTLKVMQRQIADLKTENERVQQAERATRAKSRDQALRAKVVESLADLGIKDPSAARRAMLHLVDGEKRISYRDEDDETIGFRDSNDDTVLDLAGGLKAWAKTEDGKFFLPPTGARGSGDGRGGTAPIAGNGQTDQTALWSGLAEKLFG